ncbi:hypothetical protein N658DRAFT_517913 [Parathielavia hyrcaniae]|uniref:Uncharacterized protein n=1 Tax=Parathielavia hyrcaniae TaxID=113614 RepID=A0AAN6Q054_9PEZI|nr:hypothetical protein N658DRAFT_517913 [Parathielavia hyrcaniae]
MPSNHRHRLRLREATPDDIDAIVDINFSAFDDNVMNQLMYPGGVTADSKAKYAAKLFPQDGTESPAKKGQSLLWVAEYLPEEGPGDKPGEVVAFARWVLHREPRTEAEWKADGFTAATTETWGEGCDVAVVNVFMGGMTRAQRDHAQGEAGLYLSTLACSPTRQRLGAGSALLKWGLDLADSLGLPSRLEASPAGYSLYRKFGYEDVDVLDLNVTETWGVANTDGSDWGANNAVSLAGAVPDGILRTIPRPAICPPLCAPPLFLRSTAEGRPTGCSRSGNLQGDAPPTAPGESLGKAAAVTAANIIAIINAANRGCRRVISELEDLLPPELSLATESKRKAVMTAFGWLLKESKAKMLLDELREYKSTIALALTTDSSLDVKEVKVNVEAVKDSAERIYAALTDVQQQHVYNWLHATDPTDLHEKACDAYEPDTSEWLFRFPEWASWFDGKTRCLWVHGIPGAGKTIFASHLIETVRTHCLLRGPACACVYYYCYFGHAQDEAAPFVRWILLELCRRLGRIPLSVHELYRQGGKPSLQSLLIVLEQVVQCLDKVFIFVDAVDESLDRGNLLRVLRELAVSSGFENVRVLATSREYMDIEEVLLEVATPISMRNPALDEDIGRYIKSKLGSKQRLRRWPKHIQEQVFKSLFAKANGMFRWVVCQLEALQRLKPESSIVEAALANLPRTLDETYERALTRIPEEARPFVQQTLHWMSTHRAIRQAIPAVEAVSSVSLSPLDVAVDSTRDILSAVLFEAIQHTLAREDSSDSLSLSDYALDEELLREFCGCLVTLRMDTIRDASASGEFVEVSFAHYTVLEFLESSRIRHGPAALFAIDRDKVLIEHTKILAQCAVASAGRWASDWPQRRGSEFYTDFDRYCTHSTVFLLHWHAKMLSSYGTSSWIAPVVQLLETQAPPSLGSHFWFTPEILLGMETAISPAVTNFRLIQKLRLLSPAPEPHVQTLVRMLQLDETGYLARTLLASLGRTKGDLWYQVDLEYVPAAMYYDYYSPFGEWFFDLKKFQALSSRTRRFRGSVLDFYAHLPTAAWAHRGLYDMLDFAAGQFDPSTLMLLFIGNHQHNKDKGSQCWGCLILAQLIRLGAKATAPGYAVGSLQMAVARRDLAGVSMLLEAGVDPNDIGDLGGDIGTPERGPMLEWAQEIRGSSPLNILRRGKLMALKSSNVWARHHDADDDRLLADVLIKYGAMDFTAASLDHGLAPSTEMEMMIV